MFLSFSLDCPGVLFSTPKANPVIGHFHSFYGWDQRKKWFISIILFYFFTQTQLGNVTTSFQIWGEKKEAQSAENGHLVFNPDDQSEKLKVAPRGPGAGPEIFDSSLSFEFRITSVPKSTF